VKIRKKGYVLELKRLPRKPERSLFTDYQAALGFYARTKGRIILTDEGWPQIEALLATDPNAKLHKAKLTVEF
jgi:hypothetical protein